jgi:hypothetical protein
MKLFQKRLLALVLLAIFLAAGVLLLDRYCPASGLGFSNSRRNVHRLKNRTSVPQSVDFDPQATLSNILQPGRDDTRWSQTNAARVEGYVVSIGRAGIELANCYSPCRRDIHINVALRPDAPSGEQMVLEVTPYFERLAAVDGVDWSERKLKEMLLGRWCRFEGWLFFDLGHAKESTNTFEEGSEIWRATAWELHPITRIEVIR